MTLKYVIYITLVMSQAIFSIVSYLPQIIQLIKTKKSEDISTSTWVLLSLSFFDYAVILWMDKVSISLVLLNLFELSLCVITTILVVYYKRKNRKVNA